ncbi:hypothetical protein [Roseibacillus ishigakijimensis]|uniref:Uncharacterized protein n=1 Tax=Roseibacillus ishigakijimensis TaxID=454146 RepID=A0A934RLG4_9BACT|nr:hypothetical protein [Roseibacillus ishigakijimensis]MBK1833579.1 hypothetical protein [Roseibacillus ishigakijimensis]
MKILLTFLACLLVGLLVPLPEKKNPAPEQPTATKSSHPRRAASPGPLGLADRAARLSKEEWPAFFAAHLDFPADRDLLAQLWAEADPAGFWQWLREQKNASLVKEFGFNVLIQWTEIDLEGAIAASLDLSNKEVADHVRLRLAFELFQRDVEIGAAYAARCPDFNRFGRRGNVEWMSRDPAAAVKALGGLPRHSEFRSYLDRTLSLWAEQDPQACLEWLQENPPFRNGEFWEEWSQEGYRAVALQEPQAALAAAKQLENRHYREQALLGVLSAGKFSPEEQLEILNTLPVSIKNKIGQELIATRISQHKSLSDLQLTDTFLRQVPSNKSTLHRINSLAQNWKRISPETAWDWARSLPDAAQRRVALAEVVTTAPRHEIGTLPSEDLSDKLFSSLFFHLRGKEQEDFLNNLPADHAAWARHVLAKRN